MSLAALLLILNGAVKVHHIKQQQSDIWSKVYALISAFLNWTIVAHRNTITHDIVIVTPTNFTYMTITWFASYMFQSFLFTFNTTVKHSTYSSLDRGVFGMWTPFVTQNYFVV